MINQLRIRSAQQWSLRLVDNSKHAEAEHASVLVCSSAQDFQCCLKLDKRRNKIPCQLFVCTAGPLRMTASVFWRMPPSCTKSNIYGT